MSKERYTVGRLPDNDIRIDNAAVSGHHALIINILNDSFLEDLNSTNGTYVNGKIIKKHALQHGDVITVGHHALRFVESESDEPDDEFEKTMVIGPRDAARLNIPAAAAAPQLPAAIVHAVPERHAAEGATAGAFGAVRRPRARARQDADDARPARRAGRGDHAPGRRLLHRARREQPRRRLPAGQRRCDRSTGAPAARQRRRAARRASRWVSSRPDGLGRCRQRCAASGRPAALAGSPRR